MFLDVDSYKYLRACTHQLCAGLAELNWIHSTFYVQVVWSDVHIYNYACIAEQAANACFPASRHSVQRSGRTQRCVLT